MLDCHMMKVVPSSVSFQYGPNRVWCQSCRRSNTARRYASCRDGHQGFGVYHRKAHALIPIKKQNKYVVAMPSAVPEESGPSSLEEASRNDLSVESLGSKTAEDNGTDSPISTVSEKDPNNPELSPDLDYVAPTASEQAVTKFKLLFALPWKRFKNGSALAFKLSGAIAEQRQPRFSSATALPSICDSLIKASYDPRIVGIVVKIDPLSVGWGKLLEIRRHVEFFKKSGKFTIAYIERGGEKEYFLASAFNEIYVPPSASLSLRGFSVSGSFLRGTLDKVGVEPEIRRIGAYKSAGDQLLRHDMSEEQKEQLTAILDDVYNNFVDTIALARGKDRSEVEALLDAGVYDMNILKENGWVTDLKYEDEINEMIKQRTAGKEDELRAVNLRKYASVGRSAFNLNGRGKVIAILRTSGAIVGGGDDGKQGSNITSGAVIKQLRSLQKNKRVAAIVLRVDSPGGDALASDLMWREIGKLSEEKPIVASMADVAASGGYYMSMACKKIVAETLTLTGSIGVVTGKFNLEHLYEKVGFSKTVLSRGRYAEFLNETRSFSEEEADLFDKSAQYAYEQFRNKAAESRKMEIDAMQAVAQGRVWTGVKAQERGLVDALGGIQCAIALAKEAAGMNPSDRVKTIEISKASLSPISLVTGGAIAKSLAAPLQMLSIVLSALGNPKALSVIGLNAVSDFESQRSIGKLFEISDTNYNDVLIRGVSSGSVMAQLPYVEVEGVGSLMSSAAFVSLENHDDFMS